MIKFLNYVVTSWRSIMDARYNPLRFIKEPVLQSYLMLVLFTMWSAFFGLIAMFYLGWFGYSIPVSIMVHMGILVPVVITNGVFLDAERTNAPWLSNFKRSQALLNYMKGKNVVRWDLDKES